MKTYYTEAVECCPHCGQENVYPNWNTEKQGYVAVCENCGQKIMLCDECFHSDDNKEMKCDWCNGKCFRGATKGLFDDDFEFRKTQLNKNLECWKNGLITWSELQSLVGCVMRAFRDDVEMLLDEYKECG